MTSHRYPPLPSPSQRDESDRVGEILDTVRRIEARDTAGLHATIKALEEEIDRLREEMAKNESEWRKAMHAKDAMMYSLNLRVVDATESTMANDLRERGIEVVRMSLVGNIVEVVVGESDSDAKVAAAMYYVLPLALTTEGRCWAEHDGVKVRFSRASSTSRPSEGTGRSRRAAIFAEVSKERERQEAKFPGQRLPLVEPENEQGRLDLTNTMCVLSSDEREARQQCDLRTSRGDLTWLDVAREEFAEAMHALGKLQAGHGSKAEARAECVQAIAVLVRLLESEHFDDNVIAEGSYSKAQAPHKQPAVPMVTKVTHRVGWSNDPNWRQHACIGCRIPFLVAPGDEPPKCYQCGFEATPTSAKEAEGFWSALDEVKQ